MYKRQVFFDSAQENTIHLNPNSLLIPEINFSSEEDEATINVCASQKLCASGLTRPDSLVLASPICSADSSMSENESSQSEFGFFHQTRNPDRCLYTDSESKNEEEMERDLNDWNSRLLSCLKYVDDCLSLEKVCFSTGKGLGEVRRVRGAR